METLRLLMRYNSWATMQVAPTLLTLTPEEFHRKLESSFPSVHATVAHVTGAAELWQSRMERAPWRRLANTSEFDPDPPALIERWKRADRGLLAFVNAAQDPSELFLVRNSAGQEYQHSLREMVLHVSHHQNYHRGQLTTLLRQLQKSVPSQDLIAYVRESSAVQP